MSYIAPVHLSHESNSVKFYWVKVNDFNEMFVRMLTVHCDQNNSYEITINDFQVRKINEIRNVIFGHQVLNLVNIPTSALTLRKVSHSRDRKLRFLFRLFF